MGFMALITSLISTIITYSEHPFYYETIWFNKLDWFTCIGFCIQWCFKLYVSSPRNIYLRSTDSFLDLVVFLPLLCVSEPNPRELSYSFITISRFVRIVMFTNMLTKYYQLGESDVERHIYGVVFTSSSLLYISSGIFTYIENAAKAKDQVDVIMAELNTEFKPEYFANATLAT